MGRHCKRQKISQPVWKKNEKVALPSQPTTLQKVGDHLSKSEYEIFKLFFTEEMAEEMVHQTIQYAQRDKNNPSFTITTGDMMQFLGLLLVSGYHTLPGENDYWSTADDLVAPLFASVMPRDKFRSIKRYMHLVDNQALDKQR